MARKGVAWLRREFKGVALGDARLDRRCEQVVKALGRDPDGSIPNACGSWGETKAVYRFLSNEKVDRESLLMPHRMRTAERCRASREAVVAHDTTQVNLTGHGGLEGAGLIGTDDWLRGFLVHNAFAVDGETGEALGLVHQEVWVRSGRVPKDEETRDRRKRPRESERWARGIEAVRSLGLTDVIHVADREGDIYEVLDLLDHEEARYVLRACRNRRVAGDDYLFEVIKSSPVEGSFDVEVGARPGRKARTARLNLRRVRTTIRPPKALDGRGRSIEIAVVRASEDDPPAGVEPLEWILLTSEPTETMEALIRVVRLYSRRWMVEEFHMGLKTGCGLEQRQFKDMSRMEAFLGLASVMSVMLLRLRDGARGEAGAGAYLTETQLKCLRKKRPEIGARPTARQALRALAQMGGFLARKGDGEPGWRTIWRGMVKLLFMEHGYLMALDQNPSLRGSPTCG